jgi:hypothetical protein
LDRFWVKTRRCPVHSIVDARKAVPPLTLPIVPFVIYLLRLAAFPLVPYRCPVCMKPTKRLWAPVRRVS